MTTFIQLHLLTSYPPANLNRDDTGRPKTAKMGGVDRLRISSQSLKRAWRTSAFFEEALAGHIGKRTKRLGIQVYNNLINGNLSPGLAEKSALSIAKVFGKSKEKKDKENPLAHFEIEQLVHLSPEELKKITELEAILIQEKREPTENELELLSKDRQAIDIALFGRMLADTPLHNVDAAAQVAHAISVHSVVVEDDYFTAVDDLKNLGKASTGSAHIGETSFASALFYTYLCIDRDLLLKNLNNNQVLVNKALAALTEAAIKVSPTGKQNSFASRAYASYVMAEIGDQQPRSLSVAFLKPIVGFDYANDSVEALQTHKKSIDQVYEDCSINSYEINAFTGVGKVKELIDFVCS
jgi:CRISPR system Cascade subunit CasC